MVQIVLAFWWLHHNWKEKNMCRNWHDWICDGLRLIKAALYLGLENSICGKTEILVNFYLLTLSRPLLCLPRRPLLSLFSSSPSSKVPPVLRHVRLSTGSADMALSIWDQGRSESSVGSHSLFAQPTIVHLLSARRETTNIHQDSWSPMSRSTSCLERDQLKKASCCREERIKAADQGGKSGSPEVGRVGVRNPLQGRNGS